MEESVLQAFKQFVGDVTDVEALVDALNTDRETSVRLNMQKCIHRLSSPVPWCSSGYYLDARPLFTLDPYLHAGCFYVQEASSMLIEQALKSRLNRPMKVLDLCAAPGGKTTHIMSLLPEGSLLVANEVIRNRAKILSENTLKWGSIPCIVTNNDPEDFSFLKGFFDIILVDAPCSGEGMFRKDADACLEWSPEHVDLCSGRQLRILYDIWDCLAPDGLLLYSTCTFNEKENEDVVSRFIAEQDAVCDQIALKPEWGIVEREKHGAISYRCFPHAVRGEGFSLSVIQKKGGPEYTASKKVRPSGALTISSEAQSKDAKKYIQGIDACLYRTGDSYWAIPKSWQSLLLEIANHCRIIHAGIPVIEQIGHKINPLPPLAFSPCYNTEIMPTVVISLEQAVRYFKKEPLVLPIAHKGWVHLVYNGVSIGFVKNIGNRANNPYPQEWAIKMSIDYGNLPQPLLESASLSL